MYVSWQDIGKVEASYNVKLIKACKYNILQGVTTIEMWSGGVKTFSVDAQDMEVCAGSRPPKQ